MKECPIFLFIGGFLIQIVYVISINTFYDHSKPRDYIPNIWRRFIAAFLNNFFGIVLTSQLLGLFYENPFILMGFQLNNLFTVILLPSFLTFVFYLGTIATLIFDKSLQIKEISFRACSVPLLAHCLGNNLTIFIAPISFSCSHVHHIIDDRKRGISLANAFASRGFQMCYTYLFGLYATHIFFQTGNIIAPIICHSICNNLGVPSIDEVELFETKRIRILLYFLHFIGFLSWFLLRPIILSSDLYV